MDIQLESPGQLVDDDELSSLKADDGDFDDVIFSTHSDSIQQFANELLDGGSQLTGDEFLSDNTTAPSTTSNITSNNNKSSSGNNNSANSKRARKYKNKSGPSPHKVDIKAKLERSRQSARECRARKKLRYQYLEDLVLKRENANQVLKKELNQLKEAAAMLSSGGTKN